MGRSFSNITVKGQNQNAIASYLKQLNRKAYVSPTVNDFTVIFDKESGTDVTQLANLTIKLSQHFDCPALAISIHDESVFYYELYKNGQLLDEYISDPSAFNPELSSFPEGGDAQILCKVFDATEATNKVRPILREPSTEDVYLFASKRHKDLVRKLGLPLWSTNGYRDIEEGEIEPMIFDEDGFPDLEDTLSMLEFTEGESLNDCD